MGDPRAWARAKPAAAPLFRADWAPPDWLVKEVRLCLRLDPERTEVEARLALRRNGAHDRPIRLDGHGLTTLGLRLDGKALPPPARDEAGLVLCPRGDAAVVETKVLISPARNRALLGLAMFGETMVSQCEAEGFRRITWFPDRPDILAHFHVRLEADSRRFPVLLSNGHAGACGALPGGRHYAEWHDPWPKPCYLFALVAGRLESLEADHVTRAGRRVRLRLWAEPGEAARGAHALRALARAMAFDEETFGRAPDLDLHQLVAVHGFAFGAMENKGLNIFDARHLLAEPLTATDDDLARVSAVVAHEYLHNWSGNRVPIRDWFQLGLKEGLTVWREQCCTSAREAPEAARLHQVETLESMGPGEDAGPAAPSMRPESAADVRSLYNPAVYAKGAEIIGMMARLLGPGRFGGALVRYFERFDGRPSTIEDFLSCMAEAGLDPEGFERWVAAPGEPVVSVALSFDRLSGEAVLHLAQASPHGPPGAAPLPIPLDIALWSRDGRLLAGPMLHPMTQREDVLVFAGMDALPVVSVNRGHSAPVRVEPEGEAADLACLARFETDAVARRRAFVLLLARAVAARLEGGRAPEEDRLAELFPSMLAGWRADPAVAAALVAMPSLRRLGRRFPRLDPSALLSAKNLVAERLARAAGQELMDAWRECLPAQATLDERGAGRRALGNAALMWLAETGSAAAARAALLQFVRSAGLTGQAGALAALAHGNSPEREEVRLAWRARHAAAPQAMDHLRAILASAHRRDAVEDVAALAAELATAGGSPGSIQALFSAFGQNLPALFRPDGAGVRLLCEAAVALHARAPAVAPGLLRPLLAGPRLAPALARMVADEAARIARRPGLPARMARFLESLAP